MKIIDISYWQQPSEINYEKLATEIDGAVLRVAYASYQDKVFLEHYKRLTDLGVPVGAYHFIVQYQPAKMQVDTFQNAINGKVLKLGTWCDVELENGAQALTKTRVDEYLGYMPVDMGIYTSRYYWDSIMRSGAYASRKLWVAHYGAVSPLLPATGGWNKWWLWQYTSSGKLASIPNKNIDCNYFWGSPADYNAWVGEVVVDPAEPRVPLYIIECIATTALNIRKQPWVADNIVGTLKNGEKRDVYAESNGWLNIKEGWISAAYTIRVTDVPEPPVVLSLEEKVERLWQANPQLH